MTNNPASYLATLTQPLTFADGKTPDTIHNMDCCSQTVRKPVAGFEHYSTEMDDYPDSLELRNTDWPDNAGGS